MVRNPSCASRLALGRFYFFLPLISIYTNMFLIAKYFGRIKTNS